MLSGQPRAAKRVIGSVGGQDKAQVLLRFPVRIEEHWAELGSRLTTIWAHLVNSILQSNIDLEGHISSIEDK